jgi:hypothetical protein
VFKILVPIIVMAFAAQTFADPNAAGNHRVAEKAQYIVGLNLGQTAAYGICSLFFENGMVIPIILNFDTKGNDNVGFGSMVQFRHHTDGPSLNLNEISALAGPRISPFGTGLTGWFILPTVGVGFAGGKDYGDENIFRFILMAQPEFGYTFTHGTPGLYVHLGAGVQLRYPVLESRHKIDWNELGMLVDYWAPQVNIVVGLGI